MKAYISNGDDKKVIKAFIEYLRENGYPNLTVDRVPDEENRNSSDIDAIAGLFAIEHTSIDTIANQRRDSDWFMQAAGQLEKELSCNLRYRLSITIPYEGVQKGQQWSKIRQAFKRWVADSSVAFPDGTHTVSNVPGVPFEFRAIKASDRPPGLFFSRSAHEDPSLPTRLQELLNRKAEKLACYNDAGKTSILLIESGDIARMNKGEMLKALHTGFGNSLPNGVDQLWYADTSIKSEPIFHDFTAAIKE